MPRKKKLPKFKKNKDGVEILELDRNTHKLMQYDSLYYSTPKELDKEDKIKDVKT